jgi:hypothetical protein
MTENGSQRLPMILAPHPRGDRVQKGPTLSLAEMRARQTSKLRQIADALIAAGFVSLDEQAEVLGLCRSTTWTILGGNHKGSGLSAAIAIRILAAPRLPALVGSILVEYAAEKAAGLYGGSMAQRRRFAERLAIEAVKPTISVEMQLEHRGMPADQAAPKRSRDGGPAGILARSKVVKAKRHISLKDHLRLPDSGAEPFRKRKVKC